MGSTSSDSDLASEELQRNETAAPLNTTPDGVQATELDSQLVQHGTDEGEGQTHGFRRHDTASGSPEATDADVRADTKGDKHSPANESEDDSSIDSHEMADLRADQPLYVGVGQEDPSNAIYKSQGAKYARVAAIYTEGLENRVSGIEKELLELQYQFGSKDRPDNNKERRVIYSVSCSCSNCATMSQ